MFPDDHSRVILPLVDGAENSDYVNASYLHVRRTLIMVTFNLCVIIEVNEFLVSKETVVLRRWERSKQKF